MVSCGENFESAKAGGALGYAALYLLTHHIRGNEVGRSNRTFVGTAPNGCHEKLVWHWHKTAAQHIEKLYYRLKQDEPCLQFVHERTLLRSPLVYNDALHDCLL